MCVGRGLTTRLGDGEPDLQHLQISVVWILSSWQISSYQLDVTEHELGRYIHNQLLWAATSWLQHHTGIFEKSKSLGLKYKNDFVPHKEKTPRFVRKILAAHAFTHLTPTSPVPMSMRPRENQSLGKSLGPSCLYLWVMSYLIDPRQEHWEVESTFPILMLWATRHSFPSSNRTQFPTWYVSSDSHLHQHQG